MDYQALRDQDTDTHRDYHTADLSSYAACVTCGSPTRETCVLCEKPHDHHCLFNIHLPERREDNPLMIQGEFGPERAEPDYEYARVCLACYTQHEGHPPYSWGWSDQRMLAYVAPRGGAAIKPGSLMPAGDLDAWVSHPQATKAIAFFHDESAALPRDLDAFESLSLLAWLLAWQSEIKAVAEQASAVLVAYRNQELERAREADRGYIDYSQFE